jgi:multidrug efflux pump subunit AcrA (membrane-fusion protein)
MKRAFAPGGAACAATARTRLLRPRRGLAMSVAGFLRFGAIAAAACLAEASLLSLEPAAALAASPDLPPGVMVKLVRVTRECFSDTLHATGIFVPRQEAIVVLDERFRIIEVLVAEGAQVTMGQALARVAKTALQNGPADNQPAPAKPSTTVTVRAPASGVVIQSTASIGAGQSPAAGPLFRIMIDNEIELEVDLPGAQVSKLKPHQMARIKLQDGSELIGQVRLVPAQIDLVSQLGRARLSVAQDPSLRVGMFAEATIDASQSCGIAVPRAAILHTTDGTSVQVVRNGIVEMRRVRVGLSSDSNFEIDDGLNEGDIVVANAGTSLHDGDQVQISFEDKLDK